MTLLDRILSTAQWTPIPAEIHADDLPYAIHEAWIAMGEERLHAFQLNTGQTIIEQESLKSLMGGPFGMWLMFLRKHPEWEQDVRLAPSGVQGIQPGELMATSEATKAFAQWAVDWGFAAHPERLRGYLDHLDYLTALGRQARTRRKPPL